MLNFAFVQQIFAEGNIRIAQETDSQKKIREVKEAAKGLSQLPSTSPQAIIGRGIQILMMFMGAIMFLLVVYAGVLWMTAQGNTEKIGTAKNIMIWTSLGVVAMLTSYIVISFIFSRVSGA
jgi:hypothetical protein